VVLSLPQGKTSVSYTWTAPQATDNVGVVSSTLIVGPTPTPSSTTSGNFSQGNTVMLFSASDAANNIGSCTWVVQVVEFGQSDVLAPTFTNCPTTSSTSIMTLTSETVAGKDYSTVTWPDIIASDEVGVVSQGYSSSPVGYTQGSKFDAGETIKITYTASDAAKNTNSCIFYVKVLDKEPPVVSCPALLSFQTDNAQVDTCTTVDWTVTATDNVEIKSKVTSIDPGMLRKLLCILTLTSSCCPSCCRFFVSPPWSSVM
jgi:hypothetical protein